MTVVDHFLSSIFQFLKAKDGVQLRLWFQVEPPLPQEYTQLSQELKASWIDSKKLEQYIENALPFNDDDLSEEGGAWPGFLAFMQTYLEFWRDVKFEDLLATHLQLSALIMLVYSSAVQVGCLTNRQQFMQYGHVERDLWNHYASYSNATMQSFGTACGHA
jgi:hypothetical protein